MFFCPTCGEPALVIETSVDLGPDGRSDEVAVQSVHCDACDCHGAALYEESRRGDGEHVHHVMCVLPSDEVHALHLALTQVDKPSLSGWAGKIRRHSTHPIVYRPECV